MDALFDKTVNLLSNMLDYRNKRHQVVVSNIANIDTPGYKPSDLSFKNEFDKAGQLAMATTNARHMPPPRNSGEAVQYELQTSDEEAKVDTEMANLAENNLMYNTTVEMLARKFRGLNTVLKETK
jgi:flagellar basal-body rod protein FlgB